MECLLTCGGGDFLALSHFISPGERKSIKKIYWATPARELIKNFTCLVFPNVEEEIVIEAHLREKLSNVIEYSTKKIKLQIKDGTRSFHEVNEIYNKKLCDLNFDLPEKYVVIHPHSDNLRLVRRDLSWKECKKLVLELKRKDIYGVVINKSKDKFPIKSDHIIDMTNELNAHECIEVLKQANGFVGCSSIWSVAASKLFSENLFIKSHNVLQFGTKYFYYYPNAANVYVDLSRRIRLYIKES